MFADAKVCVMDRQLIFFLLAILLSLAGCTTGKRAAYDGVSGAYPSVAAQIAQDAARHVASAYPPGQTSLAVDTESSFGLALEDALRQRGFSISDGGLPVRYQLDMVLAFPFCVA